MNIEELKQIKEDLKAVYNVMYNFDDVLCDDMQERVKRIETLLTAYEKEKGENVKLRLQDIPLIEGELKAYKDRVNELKQELEKEKEKNKELQDRVDYLAKISGLLSTDTIIEEE